MNTCPECGERVYDGICSNCQGELYIVETQNQWIDFVLSDTFQEMVEDQRNFLRRKGRIQ